MDWNIPRQLFPVTRRWVFLDHAAVAPLPRPARDTFVQYANDYAKHGVDAVSRWFRRVERVRSLAAQLISAKPSEIAFIKNTSEGIAFIAEGFPWHEGDNVVIAEEEYPSNQYPWMHLASRGVAVRRVPSRGNRIIIDDITAAIDSRTRLVSLSFVEYSSGFRNDLATIGEMCRSRGVYFFVDAIQGLGVFPLDVLKLPVDFLAADGHKWLLGPEGAGILWIREELTDFLRPIEVGWNSVRHSLDFSKVALEFKPGAGRWEAGTLNVAAICALGASLGLILELGVAAISERILALTDHFCEAANRAGVTIFSSRVAGEASGIVSIVTADVPPSEIVKFCREQGVILRDRGGRVRISPHFYNTTEELDRALVSICEAVRKTGQ